MCFSDKQNGDRPKSPLPAANVDPIPLESLQQEVEKPVEGSTAVAQQILGCHSALAVSSFLCLSTFIVIFEYFVLIMLCWQNLAKQVAEHAEFLRWAGEDIQLTADQSLQLEKMAALEKCSRE